MCPTCLIYLVWYDSDRSRRCHYCNYQEHDEKKYLKEEEEKICQKELQPPDN